MTRTPWAALVLVLVFLATTALWMPFLECPTCLAIVRKVEQAGQKLITLAGTPSRPFKTGCPDCRDDGRVSPFRHLVRLKTDPLLSRMLFDPPLQGNTPRGPYRAAQDNFRSSLKDLLDRSSLKEASLLAEFLLGRPLGQARYLVRSEGSYVVCGLTQVGTFFTLGGTHPVNSWLMLFDTDGEILDVARLTLNAPYASSAVLLPEDAVAEFHLQDVKDSEPQGRLLLGGAETDVQAKVLRIGVRGGKFVRIP